MSPTPRILADGPEGDPADRVGAAYRRLTRARATRDPAAAATARAELAAAGLVALDPDPGIPGEALRGLLRRLEQLEERVGRLEGGDDLLSQQEAARSRSEVAQEHGVSEKALRHRLDCSRGGTASGTARGGTGRDRGRSARPQHHS